MKDFLRMTEGSYPQKKKETVREYLQRGGENVVALRGSPECPVVEGTS
jgi:hypothetical protein